MDEILMQSIRISTREAPESTKHYTIFSPRIQLLFVEPKNPEIRNKKLLLPLQVGLQHHFYNWIRGNPKQPTQSSSAPAPSDAAPRNEWIHVAPNCQRSVSILVENVRCLFGFDLFFLYQSWSKAKNQEKELQYIYI